MQIKYIDINDFNQNWLDLFIEDLIKKRKKHLKQLTQIIKSLEEEIKKFYDLDHLKKLL